MKLILLLIAVAAVIVFMSQRLEILVFAPGSDSPESLPSLLNPISALGKAQALSRIAGIKEMRTAMEIYSVEWGTYPLVGASCQPITILQEHLVPNYLRGIPEELLGDEGASVSVSEDGFRYVLRVTSDTTVLRGSDTVEVESVLGCKCDEAYYCLGEYVETGPQFDFEN